MTRIISIARANREFFFIIVLFVSLFAGIFVGRAQASKPIDQLDPYNPTGTGYCQRHQRHHAIEV